MTPQQRQELHDSLARLADGDRAAFDPVYAGLWPLVRRYTRAALGAGHGAEAEDVAQEVLLRIFEQAGDFDPVRGDAATWALSIAAWECRTVRKRRSRRREDLGVAPADGVAPEADPEAFLVERELVAAARETLASLSPTDIATISARLTGEPVPGAEGATARKRIQRAFGRLRTAWRRRHGTP